MVPSDLGVHAQWAVIADVLGIPKSNQALPVLTTCPLCHGNRFSVQNSIHDGDWAYCFDCKYSGNLLELAAAIWKCSLTAAVSRLAYEGVPIPSESLTDEAVTTYINTALVKRKRFADMWAKSQSYLVNGQSKEIAALRHRFCLTSNFSNDRMFDGPAKLFGAAPRPDVELTWQPGLSNYHQSAFRLFKGRGWGDVLVVPFWNAPNSLSSFLFVGRKGEPADYVMKPLPLPHNTLETREAGLAGLPAVLDHPSGIVVAMSDVMNMLRIQMRNFNTSLRPLPLVGWYLGKVGDTKLAWDAIGKRSVVFWEPRMTPQVLIQCSRLDANLAIVGPQRDIDNRLDCFIRNYQAADLVQHIIKHAKPWRKAVAEWLNTAPHAEILQMISQLSTFDYDALDLFKQCVPSHELWGQHGLQSIRRIKIGTTTFSERGKKWYMSLPAGKEKVFTNAIIRIDKIVTRDAPEYVGRVLTNDREIPFRLPVVDTDSMTRLLAANNLQLGLRGWAYKPVHEVAIAFHTPEAVKGMSKVGWDGDAFHFRHFSLAKGVTSIRDEHAFPADCPGPQVLKLRLTDQMKSHLSKPGETQEVAWAVLISLLSSILGPLEGRQSHGVLLTGRNLDVQAKAILERLGVIQPREDEKWAHSWPFLVEQARQIDQPELHKRLISTTDPHTCHIGHSVTTYATVMQGGYVLIHHNGALDTAVLSQFPVEQILLAYLRYWTTQPRKDEPQLGRSWELMQQELVEWMTSEGIDTTAAISCRRFVHMVGDEELVHRLAGQLYFHGWIRPAGIKPGPYALVEQDDRGLVLTRAQVAAALAFAGMSVPAVLEDCPEPIVVKRTMLS